MKAKAALWTLLLSALAGGLPRLGAQDPGSAQPGPGATWYLYWADEAKPGSYAFVTDERIEISECYATVWSKVYDPEKGTETTVKELYDAENDTMAMVFLSETSPKREVLRTVTVRHPESKLEAIGEAKSRDGALYACLKGTMDMKPKSEAVRAFAEADKRLKERAMQRPGAAAPAVWP